MAKLTVLLPKVKTKYVDYYREVVVPKRPAARNNTDKLHVLIRLSPEVLKDVDAIRDLLEEPLLRQSSRSAGKNSVASKESEVNRHTATLSTSSNTQASLSIRKLQVPAVPQPQVSAEPPPLVEAEHQKSSPPSPSEGTQTPASGSHTPATVPRSLRSAANTQPPPSKPPAPIHPITVLARQMVSPEVIVISDEDDLVEEDSDSDSELSSLDAELNRTLMSSTAMHSPPPKTATKAPDVPTQADQNNDTIERVLRNQGIKEEKLNLEEMDQKLKSQNLDEWTRLRLENDKKDLEVQAKYPGYKRVPPNLHSMLYREFVLLFEDTKDDDDESEFSMIEKVVFSLKDPYSSRKIHVPVKATICRHFECFDFDTFCEYHKVPMITKKQLKKDLVSRRLEVKEKTLLLEKHLRQNGGQLPRNYAPLSKSEQVYHFNVYNKTPPLYKCPICDQKFGIKQLYISDLFNYFVKMSPKDAARVELIDKDRYRVMDDSVVTQSMSPIPGMKKEEVFEILDDESLDQQAQESSLDDLNDGQDEAILGLSAPPAGSWDDPVTID